MKTLEEILAEERLWTVRDVAHYLCMSTSWVYKRVEEGRLPVLRGIGAALRFDPDAIRAFAKGARTSRRVARLDPREASRP